MRLLIQFDDALICFPLYSELPGGFGFSSPFSPDLGNNGKSWKDGRSWNQPRSGVLFGVCAGEEGGDGETQPEWDKPASSPFLHGTRIFRA